MPITKPSAIDRDHAEHQIEAAAAVQERDHRDRRARDQIGDEVAHRIDAGAPGVGGVAGDDEVVDRHLGVDERHGEGERRQQRIAGGIDHPDHADELHQPGDGEHQMRRIFLQHAPDRELRDRAAQEHRRRDAADRDQRNAAADPLVDHLGQRDGHGVEDEAGGGADQDEQRRTPRPSSTSPAARPGAELRPAACLRSSGTITR